MNDKPARQNSSNGFLFALTIVGIFTIGCAWLFRSAIAPTASHQISKPFPPVEAAGWINGPSPTEADLQNQVVVVDAWAYWCGPCRRAIPGLITLHEKYQDRGVMFLGLTSEGQDSESIEKSREFVQSLKIPWPNGYGAVKTLLALEVEAIPQLWVVDRQNRIVFHEIGWSEKSSHEIDEAIAKALAESPIAQKSGS